VKLVTSLVLSVLFAVSHRPRLQSPIESISRELLTNFANGNLQAVTKDFNDQLRPLATPEILAQVKNNLESKAGTFLSVTEAHESLQAGSRVIELTARYSKYPVSVVVVFDMLDRIQSVYFNPILPEAPDPTLEAVTKEMATNFVAGKFEDLAKPFHPEMRVKLTPQELANIATNVKQIFGTYQSVKDVKQRVERGYRIIDLVLNYTNGPVAFRASFDPQGRVCALQIAPYVER
jgi:regulator of sirC expression with transglutaminase-like and TPR domain